MTQWQAKNKKCAVGPLDCPRGMHSHNCQGLVVGQGLLTMQPKLLLPLWHRAVSLRLGLAVGSPCLAAASTAREEAGHQPRQPLQVACATGYQAKPCVCSRQGIALRMYTRHAPSHQIPAEPTSSCCSTGFQAHRTQAGTGHMDMHKQTIASEHHESLMCPSISSGSSLLVCNGFQGNARPSAPHTCQPRRIEHVDQGAHKAEGLG